jgi:AraC family transcriptional regulator
MKDVFRRIESIAEIKLVGKRIRMSFAENRTGELWRSFMPRRREIANAVSNDLYSVEIYDSAVDMNTSPPTSHTKFDKWAAVPVANHDHIAPGFEALTLPAGLYAVFLYKGKSTEFAETFQYIFETWLPASEYRLDSRPHFEVMGEKYKHDDPGSEEEIWIPVVRKNA